MIKIMLSYSGTEKLKYLKLSDILQGRILKNHFNCIELENGIILESYNDGRYYDDNDNYEEVILWNEEEEKGLGIGYIKV